MLGRAVDGGASGNRWEHIGRRGGIRRYCTPYRVVIEATTEAPLKRRRGHGFVGRPNRTSVRPPWWSEAKAKYRSTCKRTSGTLRATDVDNAGGKPAKADSTSATVGASPTNVDGLRCRQGRVVRGKRFPSELRPRFSPFSRSPASERPLAPEVRRSDFYKPDAQRPVPLVDQSTLAGRPSPL